MFLQFSWEQIWLRTWKIPPAVYPKEQWDRIQSCRQASWMVFFGKKAESIWSAEKLAVFHSWHPAIGITKFKWTHPRISGVKSQYFRFIIQTLIRKYHLFITMPIQWLYDEWFFLHFWYDALTAKVIFQTEAFSSRLLSYSRYHRNPLYNLNGYAWDINENKKHSFLFHGWSKKNQRLPSFRIKFRLQAILPRLPEGYVFFIRLICPDLKILFFSKVHFGTADMPTRKKGCGDGRGIIITCFLTAESTSQQSEDLYDEEFGFRIS